MMIVAVMEWSGGGGGGGGFDDIDEWIIVYNFFL